MISNAAMHQDDKQPEGRHAAECAREGASAGAAPGGQGQGESLSARLAQQIRTAIADAGGWLPFDRYMALALYAPGLGYYANGSLKFGAMPTSGSDFVTAPELSPLFARALAAQVAQVLDHTGSGTVVEFGAGSGALAEGLLDTLGERVRHYRIVEVAAELRQRQQQRLSRFGDRVHWLDVWPEAIDGVVIGNEVLDAMPVQLLAFDGERWFERGVGLAAGGLGFGWSDRETALVPPHPAAFVPGTVTELHAQAEAFITSLAGRLVRGAAIFIDYGFPESEFYLPQRHGGTLMCHRGHRADADPLDAPGEKDITAHVNFTGIALAGQNAGLAVAGYTSQARFLINCGLPALLETADLRERVAASRLITEHEMGELFKVMAFTRACDIELLGFAHGDRSHRL